MTARVATAGAALLVVAGSVASAPMASAAPVPLTGTQWKFVSSGFARTAPVAYTGNPAHVRFSGDGANGSDGCNVFTGSARVSGARVTFGPLVSTQRACFAPGAGTQFAKAFVGTRTARITGERLHLSDGPRGYWNFVAVPGR